MSEVVIIGAGMAGIACARALQAAGVPVRLIDKGRGLGGRVATRRATVAGQPVTFDHGAQYLDDSDGAAAIAARAPGALAPWPLRDGQARLVGQPGMAAFPKALAVGLDVTVATRVTRVAPTRSGWRIETEADVYDAAHLVMTVPAPQVPGLIGAEHPVAQAAARARMLPCLTLMAAFDPDAPAPFVTRRDPGADLTWIARNDTKPGRSAAFRTWVAQASPGWSAAQIDADREGVKAQMAAMLCDALGADPAMLRHTGLQGWRYAFVAGPLGQDFLRDGTLWAGGDWCLGPKLQDAWLSGTRIAQSVLQSMGKDAQTA